MLKVQMWVIDSRVEGREWFGKRTFKRRIFKIGLVLEAERAGVEDNFCVTERKRTGFERESNKFRMRCSIACRMYRYVQVGVLEAIGSKNPEHKMNVC